MRTTGPFAYPFGPDLYEGCVWVREVIKDSPAWQSGLRPGMFIAQVEGRRVGTPQEFAAAIASKTQGVKLRLGANRGGEDSECLVKPD